MVQMQKCPVGSEEGKRDGGRVCADYSVCLGLTRRDSLFPPGCPGRDRCRPHRPAPCPHLLGGLCRLSHRQETRGQEERRGAYNASPLLLSCLVTNDAGLAGFFQATAPGEHRMVWLPGAAGSLGPFFISFSLPLPLKIVPLFFRVPLHVLGGGLVNRPRK